MEEGAIIRMSEVPALVERLTGVKRSRQTVYLWASAGVKGNKLETMRKAGQLFTTIEAVEAFVASLDMRE